MLGPLPAFNFYIALIEDASPLREAAAVASAFLLGGFSECSGLESEIKVEEVLAGGQNDRVFRFPGRAAYPNIVLSRGVGFGEDLYLWHEEFLKGEGKRRNGLDLPRQRDPHPDQVLDLRARHSGEMVRPRVQRRHFGDRDREARDRARKADADDVARQASGQRARRSGALTWTYRSTR